MKPKYNKQQIPVTEQEAYNFLRFDWLQDDWLNVMALENDIDLIILGVRERDGKIGRYGAALLLFCLMRDGHYPRLTD
jgi:hypothetical protein